MIVRALIPIAALALALPAIGDAATKNGITPLAPKAGATLTAQEPPTFKLRVRGKGPVWVHVCKSAKKNKRGVICSTEAIMQAKRKGRVFQVKAKVFDYPEFWLNAPGTYYWQAYRIHCTPGNTRDCEKESPVVKVEVR